MKKGSTREQYLDFARGVAILVVTIVHILGYFDFFTVIDSQPFYIRVLLQLLTTVGTPTFIILFGIFIELVYVRGVNQYGYIWLKEKVIKRLIMVYIAYVLIALTLYIHRDYNFTEFLQRIFFLKSVANANILVIYFFAILVLPIIVYIRNMYGITSILLFSILVFVLQRFIPNSIFSNDISFITSTVFGVGDRIGPSTFNSLLLISIGMLYAKYVILDKVLKPRVLLTLILISFISLILVTRHIGHIELLTNYITREYRRNNDIEYYLISMGFGFGVIYISYLINSYVLNLKVIETIKEGIMHIGRNSLVTYTTSSLALNLIPNETALSTFWLLLPIIVLNILLQLYIPIILKNIKDRAVYLNIF